VSAMRRVLALVLAGLTTGAQAQTWRTFDDGRGGSTTFAPDGILPDLP
jgi:hypothetical protein